MPGVYDTSYIDHTRTQPGETAPPVDFSSVPGFENYSTAGAAMSGLNKLMLSPSSYKYNQGGGGPYFTGHGTGRVLAEEGVTLPENFDLSQYTAGAGGEYTVGEYASLARQIADAETPWSPPGVDPPATVHMFGDRLQDPSVPGYDPSNSPVSAPALANYLDGGGRSTFNQAYADAAANVNAMTEEAGAAIRENQEHLETFAAAAGFDPSMTPDLDLSQYGAGIGDRLADEGLPIDPRTGESGGTHPEGGPLTSDPPPPLGGISRDPHVWEQAGQYLEEYMPEGYYEDGTPWQLDNGDDGSLPPGVIEFRGAAPSLAEVISRPGDGRGEGTFSRRLPEGWTPEGVGGIDQSGRGYGATEYGGKQYGQNDDYGLLI